MARLFRALLGGGGDGEPAPPARERARSRRRSGVVRRMAKDLGLTTRQVAGVIASSSHLYRSYEIPKRSGGARAIHHPAPRLKALQRWVVQNVLVDLPLHDSAYAYRRGRSTADMARRHADNAYLLRLDLRDFFHSITQDDVAALLADHDPGLSEADVRQLAKLCARHGRLTVGAPSSPAISNAVMFALDDVIAAEAEARGATYTRYADDLVFSIGRPGALRGMFDAVKAAIRQCDRPRLEINFDKTVWTSTKRRRAVVGVTLTPQGELSLGRDKKRHIRGLVHRFATGALAPDDASYLCGFLAYSQSVEPVFVDRLRAKYGAAAIAQIMDAPTVRRK